jgi:hypothetical protein
MTVRAVPLWNVMGAEPSDPPGAVAVVDDSTRVPQLLWRGSDPADVVAEKYAVVDMDRPGADRLLDKYIATADGNVLEGLLRLAMANTMYAAATEDPWKDFETMQEAVDYVYGTLWTE